LQPWPCNSGPPVAALPQRPSRSGRPCNNAQSSMLKVQCGVMWGYQPRRS
jgi:hypothetical protein